MENSVSFQGDILVFVPNIAHANDIKQKLNIIMKKFKVIIWTNNLRKKTIEKIIKSSRDCKYKNKIRIVITDIISDSLGFISDRYDYVIDCGYFTRLNYNYHQEID